MVDISSTRSRIGRRADAHRLLSVAPMMDRSDRHFRFLTRLLAPHALLYTEMLTARALLRGDAHRLLRFDPSEHPVALQLGGSDSAELAAAARIGEQAGYDEINLNVGCPSDRVRAGCFGAALMLDRERVAECVASMCAATGVPVTVKTRLGVDDHDSYEFLHAFVTRVAAAGCRTFIVHARKAWLTGLSPKENREIPPLDYARVHQLKRDFPSLTVVVNGGLNDFALSLAQLAHVDGIMLGRAAYQDPWLIASLDAALFASSSMSPNPVASRGRVEQVVERFLPYAERELAEGTPLRTMTRHLLGLRGGQPGGRRWRRALAEMPDGRTGLARLRALLEQLTVADPLREVCGAAYVSG
jgi:tRNA-dihydrouridine synthase A